MIEPGGIGASDHCLFRLRDTLQNAVDNLPGPGKGGLGMRVIRPPQQVLDSDVGAELDAKVVLLKTDEDIAPEELAGEHAIAEASATDPHGTLGVDVIHSAHKVGRPRYLEFDRSD